MIAPRVKESEPPRPLRRIKRLEEIQKLAVANLETKQECLHEPQKASQRKRKRAQEVEERPDPDRADERRKRTRISTGTVCVEEFRKGRGQLREYAAGLHRKMLELLVSIGRPL